MIYLGALLVIAIAWAIGKADNKRVDRSQRNCEEIHQKMYDLIDEHFKGSPAHAREYKADADTFINGVWKEAGKRYEPTGIKQVTTVKERRERIEAVEAGTYDDYKAHALERAEILDAIDRASARMIVESKPGNISREQGIENMAQHLTSCGMGYEEARSKAENFREVMENMEV